MYVPLAPTLSSRLWPKANVRMREITLIAGGSLLLAALAQVRLPLPFTPVPLTGQTLAVLLIGATLGARQGVASLALYLALGLAGLPVFTGGGSGLTHLAGPTGGYLLGFLAAAWLVGTLSEHGLDRRLRSSLLIFLAGEVVLYTFGLAWLSFYVGPRNALAAGLIPFLPGDAVKLILAALLLPAAWKLASYK